MCKVVLSLNEQESNIPDPTKKESDDEDTDYKIVPYYSRSSQDEADDGHGPIGLKRAYDPIGLGPIGLKRAYDPIGLGPIGLKRAYDPIGLGPIGLKRAYDPIGLGPIGLKRAYDPIGLGPIGLKRAYDAIGLGPIGLKRAYDAIGLGPIGLKRLSDSNSDETTKILAKQSTSTSADEKDSPLRDEILNQIAERLAKADAHLSKDIK